jgi:hypothetical protein
MFFTDEGAWSYILEMLETQVFIPKRMDKPPDTIGYELKAILEANRPLLYIKVQILDGRILGRSFHNSTR